MLEEEWWNIWGWMEYELRIRRKFDLELIGLDMIWFDLMCLDMIWLKIDIEFDWIWFDFDLMLILNLIEGFIWFDKNPMILQTSECEIWIKVQCSWQCSYVQSRRCEWNLESLIMDEDVDELN